MAAFIIVVLLASALAGGLVGKARAQTLYESSGVVVVIPPGAGNVDAKLNPFVNLDNNMVQLALTLATALNSPQTEIDLGQPDPSVTQIDIETVKTSLATPGTGDTPQVRFTVTGSNGPIAAQTVQRLMDYSATVLRRIQESAGVRGATFADRAVVSPSSAPVPITASALRSAAAHAALFFAATALVILALLALVALVRRGSSHTRGPRVTPSTFRPAIPLPGPAPMSPPPPSNAARPGAHPPIDVDTLPPTVNGHNGFGYNGSGYNGSGYNGSGHWGPHHGDPGTPPAGAPPAAPTPEPARTSNVTRRADWADRPKWNGTTESPARWSPARDSKPADPATVEIPVSWLASAAEHAAGFGAFGTGSTTTPAPPTLLPPGWSATDIRSTLTYAADTYHEPFVEEEIHIGADDLDDADTAADESDVAEPVTDVTDDESSDESDDPVDVEVVESADDESGDTDEFDSGEYESGAGEVADDKVADGDAQDPDSQHDDAEEDSDDDADGSFDGVEDDGSEHDHAVPASGRSTR
ncbi:hypothetical protein [Gordonia soli]|uniref:hypothetical protein n=1 Tax=Gordonia soli TaxID=320799 RepID=UPI0012F93D79|nr:hypothetical protein [Gordonia soli]